MRIGIYGGTFDPPHKGHRYAAEDAAEQLGLERLLVIPAGIPPHKELQSQSASGKQRMEMAALAFADLLCAEISDLELLRSGRSYTIDTVEALRSEYPAAELFLLMGTDMLLCLDSWKESKRLLSLVKIGVFCRSDADAAAISAKSVQLRAQFGAEITEIRHRATEVSSTLLRDAYPHRGGAAETVPDVYAYIVKNGLYGALPDFDWLRGQAYAMLKPTRIPHVQGCEQEAVRLAARWGADPDDARTAAILHDITKKFETDEQLLLCEKYGIIDKNVEKKLFHAITGAAYAKTEFGVSDAIYRAIRWHTTGRPDMNLLEKIIYIADYIEPTRDFDGLKKLRRLAYEDLDEAMILGLGMSIEELREKGVIPNSMTQKALDFLLSKRGR